MRSAAAIAIDRHRTARSIGNVVISGRAGTEIVETGFKLLIAIESMTRARLRIAGLRLGATGADGRWDELAG